MIKVYGSKLCPDCVNFENNLLDNGLEFEYININESIANLKAFLRLRDNNPAFKDAISKGYVGIPAILFEDGKIDLDWEQYLKNNGIDIKYMNKTSKTSCNIDGTGC